MDGGLGPSRPPAPARNPSWALSPFEQSLRSLVTARACLSARFGAPPSVLGPFSWDVYCLPMGFWGAA